MQRSGAGGLVIVLCLLVCAGSLPDESLAMGAGAGGQSILLGTSQTIKHQFEAAKQRRVQRAFAGLQVGSAPAVVSPQELQMMLGPEDPAVDPEEEDLDSVDIEARLYPGMSESSAQAEVPYGFAGIAWGLRHPQQAWRLLLPVLESRSYSCRQNCSASLTQERFD